MRLTYKWLKEHVDIAIGPEALVALLPTIGLCVEKMEPLPGGDFRFDLEVTANRPDCLGIAGVAREIAAQTGAKLLSPKSCLQARECQSTSRRNTSPTEDEESGKASDDARATPASLKDQKTGFVLAIEEPRLCTRYVARLITDVTVKPSPVWLRDRVEAIGLRPVNNVVDATNYVLYDTGHPLHAFDYDLLRGNTIRVRLGRRGEKMRAIDQKEYEVDDHTLVIADAVRPVAIAGIMGGSATEVGERTKNILLEAACFDYTSIRRSARVLALSSDSSYRFERQVDAATVGGVSAYAAELIRSVAGGKVAELHLDCYPAPQSRRRVALRFSRLRTLLGCNVNREEVLGKLGVLGFAADPGLRGATRTPAKCGCASSSVEAANDLADRVEFIVPSYRADVSREEDMVEEVARVIGYDSIPDVPRMNIALVTRKPDQCTEEIARKALCAAGFTEVLSASFMEGDASPVGPVPSIIELEEFKGNCWAVGVLGRDGNVERYLRTSLLAAFLRIAEVNAAYRTTELKLFEIAKRYFAASDGATERTSLAMLQAQRLAGPEDMLRAFLELKGAFEHVCAALHIEPSKVRFESLPEVGEGCQETKLVAKLYLEGVLRGSARMFSFLLRGGGSQLVGMIEADFEKLHALAKLEGRYRQISRHPGVVRDLACIFSDNTEWRIIERTVRGCIPPFLESVGFFDEYHGKGIPDGKKSIAFSMVFRAPDRTLSGEEVNASVERVVRMLESELGAVLRGKV
jgi:phenylalanyl-tRNA synthetase beta chain